MDESASAPGINKKLVIATLAIAGLLIVVGAIWWLVSRPQLISPLSDSDGDTRIVFMTPEPRASETDASASAQPTDAASPNAAVKSTPKQSPKSTPKSSPLESPASSSSPSASTQ